MYQPNPLDTSNIVLTPELLALTEIIAEQVHELWSRGRVEDGWTYGERRDDIKKTTPCLVPYKDLPESEKSYDRETALGTLRLICKIGYSIQKAAPNNCVF